LKTLLLRLNAPMQSWGSASMYDYRDSDDMPTKSGVIGIIAAALGRKRDDSVEDLCTLKFGVRIDAPGSRMTDFQITNMGITNKGKKLNSNLSRRVYLCDATFLVGLASEDEELLNKIEKGCNNPIFSIFLGRKSCQPTQPFVLGIRENDIYMALFEEPWQVSEWQKKHLFGFSDNIRLRIIVDDKNNIIKKDKPISFSPFQRTYGYRAYKEMQYKEISKKNNDISTIHDPMEELR
jgi:CRISPR system Cascade subunit CasD